MCNTNKNLSFADIVVTPLTYYTKVYLWCFLTPTDKSVLCLTINQQIDKQYIACPLLTKTESSWRAK